MVWPASIVAYALGALAVGAALRGGRTANAFVASVLALFRAWAGVAYHWLAFASINRAAWLLGALLVVEAVLLIWFGLARARLDFEYRDGWTSVIALLLIAHAAIFYPLLGLATGHGCPAMPMFAITPCPLTIFTFGLLLLVRLPAWPVLLIPLLWSLIAGTAAFLLHVPQDWLLLASGPLMVVALWRRHSTSV